jgi:hypothetical protein
MHQHPVYGWVTTARQQDRETVWARPRWRVWQADPKKVAAWKDTEYPRIAAEARKAGATVYFWSQLTLARCAIALTDSTKPPLHRQRANSLALHRSPRRLVTLELQDV